MKYLAIIFLIIFSSCGNPNSYYITESLQPYFDKFEQDIGIPAVGMDAFFSVLESPIVGKCKRTIFNVPEITIDPEWWEYADEDEREQLVYHEIGHCLLNLDHNKELDRRGCPESIMYPYVFGYANCYTNNKKYYYEELLK